MLDTRYELFVDIECDPNAVRCERKILVPMLDRLEEYALYIADRNFSDGQVIFGFVQAKSFFVIRQHGACPSWREIPNSKACVSKRKDAFGGRVSEREIEIKLADGSWYKVRRITVKMQKPTRDGDTTLHLLTNLPCRVSAVTVSRAYRSRWTIETCLGYLSQSLNAEIKTLCYPAAAGLCFCLGLTLFNIMSTLKALLTTYGKQPDPKNPIELSYYYMAHEIAECQTGMSIVVSDAYWKKYAAMTPSQFAKWMKSIASTVDLKRYRKHPRGPTKPKPKRKFTGARHIATLKILEARK